MSKYTKAKDVLNKYKCPECHGSGKIDDAELGDMAFNTYECSVCYGIGFVNTDYLDLTNKLKEALQ